VIFYLVRHAHADWRPDEQRPLSEPGKQDALRVMEMLAGNPINAVISSPYKRAVQTVEPLAAELSLKIQIEERFRERKLGTWSAARFGAAVGRTWRDMTFQYPDGESNRAAQQRALVALTELTAVGLGDHCVVGTHGNLLALILNAFDPAIGYDFWSAMSMPDVYQLQLNDVGGTWQRLWLPNE
jgi:2,3-bisphosphoglycerate-dependent phosphoglycerate mutase